MDTYDNSRLGRCGEDVRISPMVSIRRPALVTIGKHVSIDEFFAATTALAIGDYVHISTHVSVIGGATGLLTMGNFTNIATGGRVICVSDSFKGDGLIAAPGIPDRFRDTLIEKPVVFEDFANTGANVTILPGVTLPQGVAIGACSLVRANDTLERWTIYAGNPLRKVGQRNSEAMFSYAAELGYRY